MQPSFHVYCNNDDMCSCFDWHLTLWLQLFCSVPSFAVVNATLEVYSDESQADNDGNWTCTPAAPTICPTLANGTVTTCPAAGPTTITLPTRSTASINDTIIAASLSVAIATETIAPSTPGGTWLLSTAEGATSVFTLPYNANSSVVSTTGRCGRKEAIILIGKDRHLIVYDWI